MCGKSKLHRQQPTPACKTMPANKGLYEAIVPAVATLIVLPNQTVYVFYFHSQASPQVAYNLF